MLGVAWWRRMGCLGEVIERQELRPLPIFLSASLGCCEMSNFPWPRPSSMMMFLTRELAEQGLKALVLIQKKSFLPYAILSDTLSQ